MALMPKGTAGRVSPVWQANAEVISSTSKNKLLAWEFLRWAQVSPEANAIMSRGGLNCGAPTVFAYDKLYASSWQGIPGGSACVESLTQKTGFWQVTGPNWNKIQDTIITPAWQNFMRNKMTAKQLAAALQPQVNAALASGQ
jgi:ABC-type glycerol-3-phosphate transport system substrate-binding protein